MKKIVPFLLLTLFSYSLQAQNKLAIAQNKLAIETSFALPSTLLSDMKLMVFTEKIKKELGSTSITNPIVTRDKAIMRRYAKADVKDVKAIYNETWVGKRDRDDAGVTVVQYNSSALLQEYIEDLYEQSNSAYLIKDNYLIMVWSDRGMEREADLAKLTAHYQNTLKAELYAAAPFPYSEEAISAEWIPEAAEATAADEEWEAPEADEAGAEWDTPEAEATEWVQEEATDDEAPIPVK